MKMVLRRIGKTLSPKKREFLTRGQIEHTHTHNTSIQNNDDGIYLQDTQKLMEEPESNQLLLYNNQINTQYYIQNQLND